jgi:hypothetical protein
LAIIAGVGRREKGEGRRGARREREGREEEDHTHEDGAISARNKRKQNPI